MNKYKLVEINEIKVLEYKGKVFDIEVEDDHSYNIEGIAVHNSVCTTRLVTGHGIPQLSAIISIRKALNDNGYNNVGIIADGGIRNSGDIVKALAAGADAVMLGRIFAGCDETPGESIVTTEGSFKLYRGQSSRHFLNDIGKKGVAAEGESIQIRMKGSIKEVINEIVGGIRSGLTYSGASNIYDLATKAVFVEISHHGWIESTPHAFMKEHVV